jgi:uncharacterized protein (TIGR02147 family)
MTNEQPQTHYRDWLCEELAARKSKNSAYSLRAFARFLGVSKTAISDVMAGKRHLSKAAALKVSEKLELTPKQKNILLHEIRKDNSTPQDSVDHAEFLQLQKDQFKLMSDWYYIGILTLAQLKDHKADPQWIAKRLGISDIEVRAALPALQRLGLIEIRSGKLVRTSLPIQTTNQIVSPSLRKYHKQNLKLAERSIDRDPINERIFGAISIPIKLTDLSKADRLIQQFKLKLAGELDTPAPDEIYTLSIQLFPITKKDGF